MGESGQSAEINSVPRKQWHNGPYVIPEVLAVPLVQENSWNM